MRATDFKTDSPRQLVPVPNGLAFVPRELPPDLRITRELLVAVEGARGAIGKLVGQARLVDANLVMRPLARREAVLSSRIEGTQTEIREVLLQEAAERPPSEDSDLYEVLNYLVALELGHDWLRENRPFTVSLVKELHARLMVGVRGAKRHPGAFRTGDVYIGDRARGFAGARFVPPPMEQVPALMDDLVGFLTGEVTYGPLVDCAIGHYQFETIHPFEDGNGRIGRLLIPLYLVARGVLDRPFLYLSGYLDTHREEYMDRLLRVSTDGAWNDWILFFLEATRAQAEDASERVRRVLELTERYRGLVRARSRSRAALIAVDLVMERVFVTARQIGEYTKTSPPAARAAVEALTELGILAPFRRIRGAQVWVADELYRRVYET